MGVVISSIHFVALMGRTNVYPLYEHFGRFIYSKPAHWAAKDMIFLMYGIPIIIVIIIETTNAQLRSPSSSHQLSHLPHITHSPQSTSKRSCLSFNTHLGRKQAYVPLAIDPLGLVLLLS